MNALLEVQQLRVDAAGQTLLAPLTLNLCQGQRLTILGETGSGKSLLAQAIMGTLPAGLHSQGTVTLLGQTLTPHQRQRCWGRIITLLPQEPWRALDPVMKAAEQVAEVHRVVQGKSANDAVNITHQTLESLGLTQARDLLPQQLSGGMAQRLTFAAATAAGAQVVIADEPTKGLDNPRRDQLVQLLLQQTSAGALLTITHDVAVARQLGGKLIVMRQGQILEQGDTADVLAAPQSSYTRALIAAAPEHWPNLQQPAERAPLLTVSGLTQQRGGRTLFQDLSFPLHQGEILGICGTSGCGKSTLGDSLLGLLPIKAGTLRWHSSAPAWRRLKLYQDPPSAFSAAVPLQTLLQDVIRRHRLTNPPIGALLQQLQLSPTLLARNCREVSGGELQRLALLRALLLKPQLLVADEPTSRLDPITAKEVTLLLVDHARALGCGLVLISHDQQQLQKVADKVINLEHYQP